MGYWWMFTYRYRCWIFFRAGIPYSIGWINVGRIRPRSGDNRHNFKHKQAKLDYSMNERCQVLTFDINLN